MLETYEVVDTRDPKWRTTAVRLAHSKVPFLIVGAEAAAERSFNDGLKVGFGLDVTVNADGVCFRPKHSG